MKKQALSISDLYKFLTKCHIVYSIVLGETNDNWDDGEEDEPMSQEKENGVVEETEVAEVNGAAEETVNGEEEKEETEAEDIPEESGITESGQIYLLLKCNQCMGFL